MLAEDSAVGQNPVLRQMLDAAKKVDGSIVWKWECRGSASAWLIDLYQIGVYDYEDKINADKFERHYPGEWFF